MTVLPELSQTMGYTTRKTVNCQQLHFNYVVTEVKLDININMTWWSNARVELEFGVLVFMEGGNQRTRRKTLGAETRINNKLNSNVTPGPGIEPGPQWWEASTLTTTPSLYPQGTKGTINLFIELEKHKVNQTDGRNLSTEMCGFPQSK